MLWSKPHNKPCILHGLKAVEFFALLNDREGKTPYISRRQRLDELHEGVAKKQQFHLLMARDLRAVAERLLGGGRRELNYRQHDGFGIVLAEPRLHAVFAGIRSTVRNRWRYGEPAKIRPKL